MLKDAGMNLERRDTRMMCFGGKFTLGIRCVLQPTAAFTWSSNEFSAVSTAPRDPELGEIGQRMSPEDCGGLQEVVRGQAANFPAEFERGVGACGCNFSDLLAHEHQCQALLSHCRIQTTQSLDFQLNKQHFRDVCSFLALSLAFLDRIGWYQFWLLLPSKLQFKRTSKQVLCQNQL